MNAVLLCIFTLIISGCGGGAEEDNRPARAPASGVVKYNGKPVEGAMVILYATEKGGRGATGKTDADGKFVLGTFEGGDGAIPGKYKVTVRKTEVDDSGGSVDVDDPNYDGTTEDTGDSEPKNLLPEKYGELSTTDLTATIKEAGSEDLLFELKD